MYLRSKSAFSGGVHWCSWCQMSREDNSLLICYGFCRQYLTHSPNLLGLLGLSVFLASTICSSEHVYSQANNLRYPGKRRFWVDFPNSFIHDMAGWRTKNNNNNDNKIQKQKQKQKEITKTNTQQQQTTSLSRPQTKSRADPETKKPQRPHN